MEGGWGRTQEVGTREMKASLLGFLSLLSGRVRVGTGLGHSKCSSFWNWVARCQEGVRKVQERLEVKSGGRVGTSHPPEPPGCPLARLQRLSFRPQSAPLAGARGKGRMQRHRSNKRPPVRRHTCPTWLPQTDSRLDLLSQVYTRGRHTLPAKGNSDAAVDEP